MSSKGCLPGGSQRSGRFYASISKPASIHLFTGQTRMHISEICSLPDLPYRENKLAGAETGVEGITQTVTDIVDAEHRE